MTSWRHLECQKKPKNFEVDDLNGLDVIAPADSGKPVARKPETRGRMCLGGGK